MRKEFTVIAALLIFSVRAHADAARFIDPMRDVSFNIPRSWEIIEGFGETIAVLKNPNGAKIRLGWTAGKSGMTPQDALMKAVANEFRGAVINSIEEGEESGKTAVTAKFEADIHAGRANLSGETTLLPGRGGFLIVSCSAPQEKYYDMHFTCKEFIGGIKIAEVEFQRGHVPMPKIFDAPSPESIHKLRARLADADANLLDAATLVASRAILALMEGRAGCPHIADESARFAQMAAELGMEEEVIIFEKFAAMLKAEIPFTPGEILKNPRTTAGGPKVKWMNDDPSDDFCGQVGARRLYELGLSERDPRAAAQKFALAIGADPLFAPAYTALARAWLASGDGADAVKTRISELIALAPNMPETQKLKEAFGTYSSATMRISGN